MRVQGGEPFLQIPTKMANNKTKIAVLTLLCHGEFVNFDMKKYNKIILDLCTTLDSFVVEKLPWAEFSKQGSPIDWHITLCLCVWDYCETTETQQQFCAFLAKCPNVLNSFGIVSRSSSKQYLVDFYKMKVENLIPTLFFSAETNFRLQNNFDQYPELVIKPIVRSGSRKIVQLNSLDFEKTAKKLAVEHTGENWIVQPFFGEISNREYSFVFVGGNYIGAVHKIPPKDEWCCSTPIPFLHAQPYLATSDEISQASKFLQNFLALCNENDFLYVRVDCVKVNDTLFLMELEMVEPHLYPEFSESVVQQLAKKICDLAAKLFE